MERWERAREPGQCRDHHPSFSSSLLDAIYRSIDESDAGGAARVQPTGGALAPSLFAQKPKHTDFTTKYTHAVPVSERAVTRPREYHYHHRQLLTSTSSSSDGSSYGGFSSSDAESAPGYSTRPRPIRTGSVPTKSDRVRPDPPHSAPVPEKKTKSGSIRSRFRDLRKTKPPVSPGARLASFLNSLFVAGGSPKKPKVSAPSTPQPPESACSSASSHSRSCLSKTPSSRGRPVEKRSVRFGPVSVIAAAEDWLPCGPKRVYGGNEAVEKILRELEAAAAAAAAEGNDDDVASDASSDLFELENLTAIGGGGGGYRDELPVYETTHLGTNLAIAQGLLR